MKKIFHLLIILCLSMFAKAQSKTDSTFYTKATDLVIGGQITPTKNPYHRVDTANYPGLSKAIKLLLTNSAGKFVSFSTNSKNIMAKWCVSNKKQYPNLTPIANKGLDIYIKKNGKWQFAGAAGPNGLCTEAALVKDMDDSEKECLVYLPIYDEASNVEIGIDKSAAIKPMPDPFKKRILIYGSSVTQGAAASRPGMAYLARLSRETGLNFLNLGLSGNGKMEPAAAVMVAGIDADAYILDCVGNPSPQQIIERTNNMVLTIRKAHPKAPIIMMEGTVREHGYFNQSIGKMVKQQNINFEQQYKILLQQGVTDLYLIKEADWLGTDHEGTIDGSHPNDLGFDRMLHIIKPQIVAILKKYGLN